jgi:cell wall-associated NlpC family hydrolase
MCNRPAPESFIGAPFVSQGRNAHGCDCWGLVQLVCRECYGIEIPVDYDISAHAVLQVARAFIGQSLDAEHWQRLDEPKAPCVVLIANHEDHPHLVNHCGVYIGGGRFLHCLEKTGAITSRLDDLVWKRRVKGFYRWIGNKK